MPPLRTSKTDSIEARLLVPAACREIRIDTSWIDMGEHGPERLRRLMLASMRRVAPDLLPLREGLKLGLLPRLAEEERRVVADDMLGARRGCLDAEDFAFDAYDPAAR
ncbi:MAG: hypothetical protein U1E45_07640 [Geminicoccaceae bacterium]